MASRGGIAGPSRGWVPGQVLLILVNRKCLLCTGKATELGAGKGSQLVAGQEVWLPPKKGTQG